MAKEGFHHGAFQRSESLWLSDNGKSALELFILPESWEHEHAAFYHAHPSVLDSAFQLISFFIGHQSAASTRYTAEILVPSGIRSLTMHRRGKFHNGRRTWARTRLKHDSVKTQVCKIELVNKEEKFMMSA